SYKLVFHSQFDPQELTDGVKDITFPQNGTIGYAADADRILKTTDGGLNWSVVRTDAHSFFSNVEGVDDNNIIASSVYTEKILKTNNAGLNWSVVALPSSVNDLGYVYFRTVTRG